LPQWICGPFPLLVDPEMVHLFELIRERPAGLKRCFPFCGLESRVRRVAATENRLSMRVGIEWTLGRPSDGGVVQIITSANDFASKHLTRRRFAGSSLAMLAMTFHPLTA